MGRVGLGFGVSRGSNDLGGRVVTTDRSKRAPLGLGKLGLDRLTGPWPEETLNERPRSDLDRIPADGR